MAEFKIIKEIEYRNKGVYLWRYFDLHKFYNFLKNKEIRFTRMDEFEDPLEGVPLSALIEFAEQVDLEIIGDDKLSDLILDRSKLRKLSPAMQERINSIKEIQRSSFVSCWFLGKRESMAMWNLYSNSDGVAIRISTIRLFEHFKNYSYHFFENGASSFYCGKVEYQDFKTIDTEDDNLKVPRVALRKDVSYSHEQEFRFVIRTKDDDEERDSFSSFVEHLRVLRMKVVCHPLMPEWKRKNIQQMLNDVDIPNTFSVSEIRLRKDQ